jgi:GT2 family glycosyltransferase
MAVRIDWSVVRVTVILPFHRTLEHLAQSLPAARRSLPEAEILVVADGAVEDCRALAAASDARVIDVAGPRGPATARNRAAAVASGDVLVFVDADVVAAPSALAGMCDVLERDPGLAGVFGAYGRHPAAANFVSQYRNLAHAFVHEQGRREATTFWAGLGAMRAEVFRAVGGFDERFARPSVEDIDLGYRVRRAGHRLRLDPAFRGEHLKPWTLWSGVATDIAHRGIPWTQLILKYGVLADDLNTRHALRWSVVLAYVALLAVLAATVTPWGWLVAAAALLGVWGLNHRMLAWLAAERGRGFALRAFPLQLIHHLGNGVSWLIGAALHLGARVGIRLPGTVALADWPR